MLRVKITVEMMKAFTEPSTFLAQRSFLGHKLLIKHPDAFAVAAALDSISTHQLFLNDKKDDAVALWSNVWGAIADSMRPHSEKKPVIESLEKIRGMATKNLQQRFQQHCGNEAKEDAQTNPPESKVAEPAVQEEDEDEADEDQEKELQPLSEMMDEVWQAKTDGDVAGASDIFAHDGLKGVNLQANDVKVVMHKMHSALGDHFLAQVPGRDHGYKQIYIDESDSKKGSELYFQKGQLAPTETSLKLNYFGAVTTVPSKDSMPLAKLAGHCFFSSRQRGTCPRSWRHLAPHGPSKFQSLKKLPRWS